MRWSHTFLRTTRTGVEEADQRSGGLGDRLSEEAREKGGEEDYVEGPQF